MNKRQREPLYRVDLSDSLWQVTRPRASIPHAFNTLDEALSFIRSDSNGEAEFAEIVAEGTYMVKKLDRST
jgi:hypothetical protein